MLGEQPFLDLAQPVIDLSQTGLQIPYSWTPISHEQSLSVASGAAAMRRIAVVAAAGRLGYAAAPSSEIATSATSVGVRPTRTPLASSASAFATAVPLDPDTIAPAWPIVLPGGAVKPAM